MWRQGMAASFQARLSVWIIKWRIKRRLKGVRDYRVARRILHPDPYKVPSAVHISPIQLGGVPGERLEGPSPDNTVLLYLHGGGYFACSAETHRSITVFFALQGFRVFAPDYRLAPENQFPAAVDDAVAVYRSLLGAGHTSERIVVRGSPPAVVLHSRSCSLCGPQAFRFRQPQPSFLPGPILPRPVTLFEPTPIAAPCSAAPTSRHPQATILATPIPAIPSRLLSTPISPAFHLFSSMSATTKFCAMTPPASLIVPEPLAFPSN